MKQLLTATLVPILTGSLLLAAITIGGALALFTNTDAAGANTFATDTLDPPTSLTATGGASIDLSWTATADTYANGHRVLRATASGGPYTQIAEVTPRTTTTYADSPANGTYYYVVRAFFQNWESANSNEASATKTSGQTDTGYLSPSAEAADTGGDGDGYEDNPTAAFSLNADTADDRNSGTNTATSCSDAGKDRHRFYDYGISIPGGATVDGIEVRLDARVDSTVGAPFICVELSWDGGASWTAAQTTPTLGIVLSTFILGSSSDTWGRTWNASTEFTNANFRIRVTDVAAAVDRRYRIDWIAVQVTYTP